MGPGVEVAAHTMETAEVLEKNGGEMDGGRKIPSMAELKEKMQKEFPQPETAESPVDERPANAERPSKVTLEDGTEITLPENGFSQDAVFRKLERDDNGNIYCIDGNRQPNITYELKGSYFVTDEKGRITDFHAKPERSPENPRDNDAQLRAGGEDRRPTDQGGHLVARDLNGDGGIGNLVAMDSRINQSDYKLMENDIKSALDEGKDVVLKGKMDYPGDSQRPDRITSTVTTDGLATVYKFDNNLDGSLWSEIPESEKAMVQNKLDKTGGRISSIREEYNSEGGLEGVSVHITYTNENGKTSRISVSY